MRLHDTAALGACIQRSRLFMLTCQVCRSWCQRLQDDNGDFQSDYDGTQMDTAVLTIVCAVPMDPHTALRHHVFVEKCIRQLCVSWRHCLSDRPVLFVAGVAVPLLHPMLLSTATRAPVLSLSACSNLSSSGCDWQWGHSRALWRVTPLEMILTAHYEHAGRMWRGWRNPRGGQRLVQYAFPHRSSYKFG